jgi:hypothetical protein
LAAAVLAGDPAAQGIVEWLRSIEFVEQPASDIRQAKDGATSSTEPKTTSGAVHSDTELQRTSDV